MDNMKLLAAIVVVSLALALGTLVSSDALDKPAIRKSLIVKRDSSVHRDMMHNHLSRKVFERACSASKDTIDEIVACLTNNEFLVKNVDKTVAASCYKDSYGTDFDPKEISKHKELICKNREKFEVFSACVYRKTAESVDAQKMEKLTEAMVDVGLCIINALDS